MLAQNVRRTLTLHGRRVLLTVGDCSVSIDDKATDMPCVCTLRVCRGGVQVPNPSCAICRPCHRKSAQQVHPFLSNSFLVLPSSN